MQEYFAMRKRELGIEQDHQRFLQFSAKIEDRWYEKVDEGYRSRPPGGVWYENWVAS